MNVLARPATRIEDLTIAIGRQVVEDSGASGERDVVFAVASVNGVVAERLPVANAVLSPARAAAPRVGTRPATVVPGWATGADEMPSRIADPAVAERSNSGNEYFGGLRFDRNTRERNGVLGYPERGDLATRAVQLAIAGVTRAPHGYGARCVCGGG